MISVRTSAIHEAQDRALRHLYGVTNNSSIEKCADCPVCGHEIGWFTYSASECPTCKTELPPFSEIHEHIGARLEYHKEGDKTITRRGFWRMEIRKENTPCYD